MICEIFEFFESFEFFEQFEHVRALRSCAPEGNIASSFISHPLSSYSHLFSPLFLSFYLSPFFLTLLPKNLPRKLREMECQTLT